MRAASLEGTWFDDDPQGHGVSRVHVGCLLALTFGTGIVDSLSWISLNGVFTSNMSGNVLLLSMGAVGAGGTDWGPALFSLGWFLLGAAVAGRIGRGEPPRWTSRTTAVVAGVAVLLTVVAAATAVWPPHRFAASAFTVTAVLSFAMGAQGAAAVQVAVSQIITVAVSSTAVGLGMTLFLGVGLRDLGVLRRMLAIVLMGLGAAVGGVLAADAFAVGILVASIVAASAAVVGHRSRDRL